MTDPSYASAIRQAVPESQREEFGVIATPLFRAGQPAHGLFTHQMAHKLKKFRGKMVISPLPEIYFPPVSPIFTNFSPSANTFHHEFIPLEIQSVFVIAFTTVALDGQVVTDATAQPGIALTPPMGWNSYDAFGSMVTEAEVRANADYMARNLKAHGYRYIVVDFCWSYPFQPRAVTGNYPQLKLQDNEGYTPWLAMDQYGRLLPDPWRFPSSAGGRGFKPLADYVHSLGLKFGIHVMRGIPRQAVWARTPVKGS